MSTSNIPLSDVTFSVTDMICDGCAERVQTILARIDGVRKVKSSVRRKRVWIQFDAERVETGRLQTELEAGGFEAAELTK